jgi:hypothetical protein
MPLIEFKCASGHLTERLILSASEAEKAKSIKCECGATAKRVEFSLTGAPAFVEGSGGFYKPTSATASTHSTSGADNFIKDMQGTAPGKKLTNILG